MHADPDPVSNNGFGDTCSFAGAHDGLKVYLDLILVWTTTPTTTTLLTKTTMWPTLRSYVDGWS